MATNEKIQAALSQLDHSNNDHWTPDGSPRTSVVQRIVNDHTITKAQIAAASPGFVRQVGDAMGDPPEETGRGGPKDVDGGTTLAAPPANPNKEKPSLDYLQGAINAAKAAIDASMRKEADARDEQGAARRALDKAVADLQRHYPPITRAELVQAHLKNAAAEREANVIQSRGSPSPIDFSMKMGGKRPRDASGSRGQRGYTMPDGRQVFGAPRRAV